MKLSKMVEMAESIQQDAVDLIRSNRGDAATEGFDPDVWHQIANAQIDKDLNHLSMLLASIKEDAIRLEALLQKKGKLDEEGEETGRPLGRYMGVSGGEIPDIE